MDLSFDKLLEQFDLKRNEHQKNMHKVNKRIDEIESNMEHLKKQLHHFDSQIVNLEKELKSTFTLMNNENETNNKNQSDHHEKNSNLHVNYGEWIDDFKNNVAEFSEELTNKLHINNHDKDRKEKSTNLFEDIEDSIKSESNQKQSRSSQKKQRSSIQGSSQVDQNESDESIYQSIENNIIMSTTGAAQHSENGGNTNQIDNQQTAQNKTRDLEFDPSDLAIADWEDKTTNLSMSEWFAVDPIKEK